MALNILCECIRMYARTHIYILNDIIIERDNFFYCTHSGIDSLPRIPTMSYSKFNYMFREMYMLYIILWIAPNYYLQLFHEVYILKPDRKINLQRV